MFGFEFKRVVRKRSPTFVNCSSFMNFYFMRWFVYHLFSSWTFSCLCCEVYVCLLEKMSKQQSLLKGLRGRLTCTVCRCGGRRNAGSAARPECRGPGRPAAVGSRSCPPLGSASPPPAAAWRETQIRDSQFWRLVYHFLKHWTHRCAIGCDRCEYRFSR